MQDLTTTDPLTRPEIAELLRYGDARAIFERLAGQVPYESVRTCLRNPTRQGQVADRVWAEAHKLIQERFKQYGPNYIPR